MTLDPSTSTGAAPPLDGPHTSVGGRPGPAARPGLAARLAAAPASLAARLIFIALLVSCPLLPQLGNSFPTYPAVSHFWVLLPFCGLFLLPLIDFGHLRRMVHLDLLVLLSFAGALGFWERPRLWPLLFIYAPLIYLLARMAMIARVGTEHPRTPRAMPFQRLLPRSWLIVGIVVLTAVHVNWTLNARVNSDVGYASVHGAQNLLHGHAVYGADPSLVANLGYDPHYDTYGPVNYEAYIPFAGVAGTTTAARLATLFFDLLTAALLFTLGRQVRGPTAGVTLAYAWLAFPFTLYADALGANDAILAAALVATLIVARSPARRGAIAALAVWTKLGPLALLPVLAGHDSSGRSRRRRLLTFAAAFVLLSAAAFVPVLLHSSPGTIVARTFGFQFGRPPSYSIWERLGDSAFVGSGSWIKTASGVAHGLITALVGGFALALLWMPRRRDVIGLAAASAAVLLAMQFCAGYYSFTYILWFVPLVLVGLLLPREEPHAPERPNQEMTVSSFGRRVRISFPPSVTTTRSSIRTPS
jgi:hypothetical protein